MLFEITSTCRNGDGYLYCRTIPKHPNANCVGLIAEHRVIMENKLGRLLTSDEIVHHIDEDKHNNDPSNLKVMTRADHVRHHIKPAKITSITCPHCGHTFELLEKEVRFRKARNKSGLLFCSSKCSANFLWPRSSLPVNRVERIKLTCPTCGEKFQVLPSVYRRKMKIQKHGKLHCSRSCASKRVSNLELRIKRTSVSVRNT